MSQRKAKKQGHKARSQSKVTKQGHKARPHSKATKQGHKARPQSNGTMLDSQASHYCEAFRRYIRSALKNWKIIAIFYNPDVKVHTLMINSPSWSIFQIERDIFHLDAKTKHENISHLYLWTVKRSTHEDIQIINIQTTLAWKFFWLFLLSLKNENFSVGRYIFWSMKFRDQT